MKIFSKASSAFALALLVSMPVCADFSMPDLSLSNVMKTSGLAAIGAAVVQLYTQKAASEKQIRSRRSILDEETLMDACKRLWSELGVGQRKKEKELDRIENGKCIYTKYPATGIAGKTHEIVTDNALPIATCLIVMQETTKKLVLGSREWSAQLGEWVKSFMSQLPTSMFNPNDLEARKN